MFFVSFVLFFFMFFILVLFFFFFFFNDTATTEIYTLSLHDAVPILRYGRGGAGARSRDCPRSRRGGAPCPYRRVEVRRSSATLPPSRDLRARGCEPGDLHLVGLGRGDRRGLGSADRRAHRRRDGIRHLARRRYAGAGVGAGHGQDQDRAIMGICSRRAAIRRCPPASSAVLLLAGPE